MFRYVIRRVIAAVITLLVITMVTFGVFFMVPKLTGTDPALLYIGKQADKVAIEGARKKMGLDKPLVVQYGLFLKGIATGRDYDNGPQVDHCPAPCFGYSFKTQQNVWSVMMDRLPVTGSLAVGAAFLWLLFGLGSGVISALRKGSAIDRTVMVTALAGVSLPIYFTGLLSAAIFVYSLNWLPSPGYVPFNQDPVGWAQGLILPWVTLSFLFAATYARQTRAAMLETLSEDYIRTARAKGLQERRVIGRHAMRATLTPISTMFGMDMGLLLGGAVLTETVFNLHGLGLEAKNAITSSDLPMILGISMLAAFFMVFANLIVDLLYVVIDPRVRLV